MRVWRRVDPTTATDTAPRPSWDGGCTWTVAMRDGVPLVSLTRDYRAALPDGFSLGTMDPPRAVQVGVAGVLLGFDRGEWGGSLTWHSNTGTLKGRLLAQSVVAILPAFDQFIVLTAGGELMAGHALEVRDRKTHFELGRTVELPHWPGGGAIDRDGSVLVATTEGLLSVSRNLRVRWLLRTTWPVPTSVAVATDGLAYVAMNGVVVEVQFSTTSPVQTWLYPF